MAELPTLQGSITPHFGCLALGGVPPHATWGTYTRKVYIKSHLRLLYLLISLSCSSYLSLQDICSPAYFVSASPNLPRLPYLLQLQQQQQSNTGQDTDPSKPTIMTQPKLKTTIAILGCGDVGSTLAYTLILQPICSEVILVDPKQSLLTAQVRDLSDATHRSGSSVKIRAGTHADAGQADIVVITAGAKQKPGESRLSLLSRNLHILESIFSAMAPISPHTILLLVANPVDILTYFARKMSGLPESQVLGTGTSLDSARLRGLLAEEAEVAPSSIDAYVLGEHGDSQFVSCSFSSLLPSIFTGSISCSLDAFLRRTEIQGLIADA